MSVPMQAYVDIHDDHRGLRTIEFFHPKHNSLPRHILTKLAKEIQRAGNDENVQLILLKSGGDRTFCAGASFDELIAIDNIEEGKAFFMGFANVINACRMCPKLIIGRIQGKAVGGGVGLASAVDYCLATKYASIKLSELNVGIGPFVVGPAVERKIGLSAMSQMALQSDLWYDSSWAKNHGLYAEVYDDVEELDAAIEQLTIHLLETNPEARQMLKQVFWENCGHWEELLPQRATMSGKLVLSEFTKMALNKYRK